MSRAPKPALTFEGEYTERGHLYARGLGAWISAGSCAGCRFAVEQAGEVRGQGVMDAHGPCWESLTELTRGAPMRVHIFPPLPPPPDSDPVAEDDEGRLLTAEEKDEIVGPERPASPLMMAWRCVLQARTPGDVVWTFFAWWRVTALLEQAENPAAPWAERERAIAELAEVGPFPWREHPSWAGLERSLRYAGAEWRMPLTEAEWEAFVFTDKGVGALQLRWLDGRSGLRPRLVEEGLKDLRGSLAYAVADRALRWKPIRDAVRTGELPSLYEGPAEFRQEAVAFILEKLLPGDWQATRRRTSDYLVKATAYFLLDRLQRPEVSLSPSPKKLEHIAAFETAHAGEAILVHDQFLAGLTPRQQAILDLQAAEEMSIADIAERVGCSRRTIDRDLQEIRERSASLLST